MNPTASPPPNDTLRREIVSRNPATLAELGRVPILDEAAVRQAVARARAAQPAWAALGFKERARVILRAKDVLVAQSDEICELISRETGKPAVEALASEVFPIANLMDYFARQSESILREER